MNCDGQAFFQSLAPWWDAAQFMLILIIAAAVGNYLEHELRALFSRLGTATDRYFSNKAKEQKKS